MDNKSSLVQWGSRWAFVLAASGSAIGLGNIWKFPYIMGKNGGAAFVLIYLLCMVIISMPIMMSEIILGRMGKRSPINTMRNIVHAENASGFWKIIGWMGLLTGVLILSYYSVIAGWTIFYSMQTISGGLSGLTPGEVGDNFANFISNPTYTLICHSLFMLATILIIARGVNRGIELAVRILMPILFITLLILMCYSIATADFSSAWRFMFAFDLSKVTGAVIVDAIGHAFFTLSLGMGAILMYGAYLPKHVSVVKTSAMVITADTLIALIAGLTIFPIVFAYGLEPGAGPGLIFVTLPIAFAQMTGGSVFGGIFFVLLLFAAWTSALSLLEPAVAWLTESKNMTRKKAAWITGLFIWLVGLLTVMSFSSWAFEFNFLGVKKTNGLFDMFDILTSNITLPLGGILMALFVGWVVSEASTKDQLALESRVYKLWQFAVRFISPIAIAIVLYFLVFGSL